MNRVQIVRRTALILGIMLALCVIGSRVVQWSEVAAIQNALPRNWEVSFNVDARPRFMPVFLDDLAARLLSKVYAAEQGKRNTDVVYRERFRSLFRGPIRSVDIYYPDGFDERLANAISHMPQLERFGLNEHSGTIPTEEDWDVVLRSVGQLPKLKELEISGDTLTTQAVHRLKGARKLQKLYIEGCLDGTCLEGLENLHELRELEVVSSENEDGKEYGFSQASLAIFLPALARLDRLEVLSFDAERATSGQWMGILQSLAHFPNLRELNIRGKSLTNELLTALADAPKLATLTVSGPLDADCAASLKGLPALKTLVVNSTLEPSPNNQGLGEAGRTKLRAALPNVRVNAQ